MAAKNNFFSDWIMLNKSSPLKLHGQMKPNLAGSIYVRSKPGIDGPLVFPQSKLCPTAPPTIQDGCCFFKVMIISLWNLLQYHSIVRWAIQAQWAEPLVCCCRRVHPHLAWWIQHVSFPVSHNKMLKQYTWDSHDMFMQNIDHGTHKSY